MTSLAINAEGLVKAYGPVVALDGVDLAVPEGTVLGLLGPNGAGKTTAVRILTTLLRPDAGRAEIAGVDVVAHPQAARSLIGLAGQYAAVDELLTGRENLVMAGRLNHLGTSCAKQRADELLDRFGLSDAGGRTVKAYSGGMRRRLDLSVALVARPPVLFLDEPTTGLDPRSRTDLWEVIEELVGDGTTLLLTTQYLEEADRLADRIAVIDAGRVIARGTAAELKADLGATVVEVGFGDAATAGLAVEVVRPYGTLTGPDDSHRLQLTVNDGPHVLVQILRGLDAANLAPARLAVREPSLNDVFLSLTGRPAEPGADLVADANRSAA
ncbi:MAG: ATP-binding cassette domain-containing protein [Nocardioidaceae bacterium]|nr:ATP-binding cassette domain-containing protein [Nocardioidaceae bacterium]